MLGIHYKVPLNIGQESYCLGMRRVVAIYVLTNS